MLLYRYAMAAKKAPTDPEEILREFPSLAGETQMAYRFLAQTIQRDTEKWKAKQRRYQEAAVRRTEESPRKPGPPDQEDVGWMRRFVEARQNPEKPLD